MKGEFIEGNTDPLQLIRKAAVYIGAELKKSEAQANLGWPPQPQELDKDYRPLTPLQTEFLKTLPGGDSEKPLTARVNRFICSVLQDFTFAVSGGSCNTAKQILLPWDGNVEVIKLLNGLGHAISCSKLEVIETALCSKKIESKEEMALILPSNVYPVVATTLVFDNID